MADTGSLILFHKHDNKETLDDITSQDSYLYFKGIRVCDDFSESDIQQIVKNAIVNLNDYEDEKYKIKETESESSNSIETESTGGEST